MQKSAAIDTPAAHARCWALLACAGSGTRAVAADGANGMNGMPRKQYQAIAGMPLVWHTLAAFAAVARVQHTVVVIAPHDAFWPAVPAHLRHMPCSVAACGGATRAASVANGLQALRQRGAVADDWVLVHDAARCLITPRLIDVLIDACAGDAVGGLLALPVSDTLICAAGGAPGQMPRAVASVARADKWLAQTPQMFRLAALENALRHAAAAGHNATDEASAMQALGLHPLLVRGSAQNIKVTWPEDFALAQALLLARRAPAGEAAP